MFFPLKKIRGIFKAGGNGMEIKIISEETLEEALDLIWSVFLEFEGPEYTEEGINEFKKTIDFNSILEKVKANQVILWGCFLEGTLAGVLGIRDKTHICLLFVRKELHKQGIAKGLFQKMKEICEIESPAAKITVNSSPYAVQIYRRLGFSATDKEQTVNGIRFTPMEYFE